MTKTSEGNEPASRFHDASVAIRETVLDTVEAAREKVSSASDKVVIAGEKAAAGIGTNPAIALAGGIALGAIAAALLPRTSKETELLGGVGGQINDAAKAAFAAGKAEGGARLGELGISGDAAKEQVSKLLSSAGEVASAVAAAALKAAKDSRG